MTGFEKIKYTFKNPLWIIVFLNNRGKVNQIKIIRIIKFYFCYNDFFNF